MFAYVISKRNGVWKVNSTHYDNISEEEVKNNLDNNILKTGIRVQSGMFGVKAVSVRTENIFFSKDKAQEECDKRNDNQID